MIMGDVMYFRFPEEGVEIIVPRQFEHPFVDVVPENMAQKPGQEGGDVGREKEPFVPHRNLITFEVVDVSTGAPLTTFNPPITLKLYFNFEDVRAALEYNSNVAYGYWDGEVWTRFTVKDHQVELHLFNHPQWAGYADVTVRDWDDPTIAVGR
jgi:hypothetical protein